MLAASGAEPVREAEELGLVDCLQHRDRGPLDNLVFQGRDRERALSAVRLRDIPPPCRLRPIRSPPDPLVQILDPTIEVCLVGPPSQSIHTRCRVPLESKERSPQHGWAEMVVERGEPLRPPLPCRLPYAVQPL